MILASSDTIAAIATPPGEGGIAVVRISGPKSRAIADRIFEGKAVLSAAKSHTAHFGRVIDPANRAALDEVVLTVMWAPNSYTAEDVVEVSCHGGRALAQRILELCLQSGARLAHPGEFTLRAFLNGRIDLVQAEAVADLISARTESALRAAANQLAGNLSSTVDRLGEMLRDLLALLEAYTDFPEEEIGPGESEKLLGDLHAVQREIRLMLDSYEQGRIIRDGLKVAIVGPPNVGKSSIFNRLLDEERAIVTAIPGTTRDTISEYINIAGIPVELIDTAGLRSSDDPVESEGVRRTQRQMVEADLVLAVGEATCADPVAALSESCEALAGTELVPVLNKTDLVSAKILEDMLEGADPRPVLVSALTGGGFDLLRQRIGESHKIRNVKSAKGEVVITNSRHREALSRAVASLAEVEAGLQAEQSYELLAFDLKQALSSLEEIIGKTTPDDTLERIFSRFCIGK